MSSAAVPFVPPLREGDRLSAEEFLRRWEAMPNLKFAELIDGTVFMPSPVSKSHGSPHSRIGGWLWLYEDSTPGCESFTNTTTVMSDRDVPQPDSTLRILPGAGGQSGDSRDYLEGGPELVVEVSHSTSTRDLGVKMELYRRSGVREYLTVLVKPQQIIWRELVQGRYEEIAPDEEGLLRSRVFPGLWLDPKMVWDRDMGSMRTAVEQGLRSPEHSEFVNRLRSLRGRA